MAVMDEARKKKRAKIKDILKGLNPAQREAVVKTVKNPSLVIAGAGSGKALKNDSIVQTPHGPIAVQNLKVGDTVFNTRGTESKIVGVFPQGEKEIWRVTFSDNTIVECCEEHLWTYQTASMRSKNKGYKTATIKEIYENEQLRMKSGKHYKNNIYIPMTEPVQYKESKGLLISPYLLGALLGDGYLRTKHMTFSNVEKDVLDSVNQELNAIGYELGKSYDNITYGITMLNRKKISPLREELLRLNLLDCTSELKFIPNEYLRGSVTQRIQILKGLIDTDGYCVGSSYEYSTSSYTLATNIQELIESLGMTAVMKVKEDITYKHGNELRTGRSSYILRIKPSEIIQKLHTSEKHEKRWKKGQSHARRTITDIKPTNILSEMTCISVDSDDKLFLTNHFIVTHNTRVLQKRVAYILANDIDPRRILTVTFTNKAAGEMKERIGQEVGEKLAKKIMIGTFHSLAVRWLHQYHNEAGLKKNWTIYDDSDTNQTIAEILKNNNMDASKQSVYAMKSRISNLKNDMILPKDFKDMMEPQDKDFLKVYTRYMDKMARNNAVDFDDLIMKMVILLESNASVRRKFQARFKYVMVNRRPA